MILDDLRVGFTGTQDLSQVTEERKERLRLTLQQLFENGYRYFHHGDCVGADALAHDLAKAAGFAIHIHPPVIETKRAFCKDAQAVYPAKQYLKRNHDIVEMANLLLALPKDPQHEELRSGTWATVRYARKRKLPISIM